VFLDRLPQQPYRPVGIVEVTGSNDLGEIVRTASEQGRLVGCDVLVDRAIHRVSAAPAASADLTLVTYQAQPVIVGPSPPPHQFICGIFVRAPKQPTPVSTGA
jgi:hypothetical protein